MKDECIWTSIMTLNSCKGMLWHTCKSVQISGIMTYFFMEFENTVKPHYCEVLWAMEIATDFSTKWLLSGFSMSEHLLIQIWHCVTFTVKLWQAIRCKAYGRPFEIESVNLCEPHWWNREVMIASFFFLSRRQIE